MNKADLKDELLRVLTSALEELERAHRATQEGATHEEAKPENDKDTRALEQSYLARGQAQRVIELRKAVADTQNMPLRRVGDPARVVLGALLRVEEHDGERAYFIAPAGGGTKLAGGTVDVVTPSSPLGRALLGAVAGESREVRLGNRAREIAVLSIE